MSEKPFNGPTILVVLGATGDLMKRKIGPAVWHLLNDGVVPDRFEIVGFAKDEFATSDFQDFVVNAVRDHETDNLSDERLQQLVDRISYVNGLFDDLGAYSRLAEHLEAVDERWGQCSNKLFYLAVPPPFYEQIFVNLHKSQLSEPCDDEHGWTRVLVEKPFGEDLETAQRLDRMLGELFKEEQIYRIDHYLAKEMLQNILAWRFSNYLFEQSWHADHIEKIELRVLETIGVGERGHFYDGIGALRDVGQNHLLQMLALVTMETPSNLNAEAVRNARCELLKNLQIFTSDDVQQKTRRAQYAGYRNIDGVATDSHTETYFSIEAEIQNDRWRGVPILMEAGKSLQTRKKEIVVTFRHMSETCLWCQAHVDGAMPHGQNRIVFTIEPDEGIAIEFWSKKPGLGMDVESRTLNFMLHDQPHRARPIEEYEKVLLDCVRGDQTAFVSSSEVEAMWKFIDPIETAWRDGVVELDSYEQGTDDIWHADEVEVSVPLRGMIGYIGLGKMGFNMVHRLVERHWGVVATDPNSEVRVEAQEIGAKSVESTAALVERLRADSENDSVVLWLMVPHQVVDDVLSGILGELKPGDIVIDGGNSNYKETVRRAELLREKGVRFLDVGVSGGPAGAREGACLMIGGDEKDYRELQNLWQDLAVDRGYAYMGRAGAGHFVKMVHNGIEYGMMQAIGEGFDVMRASQFELDLERVANVFNNGSVIESRLIDWLKTAYEEYGVGLEDVSGTVKHSGEGLWTVEAAKELGIPVAIIEGALQFRVDSEGSPSYTGQVVSALRNQFGGHEVKR